VSVFGGSILASPPVIGGVMLNHFSAFHALALIEIESPYIEGGEVTVGDTAAALLICKSTRKDGLSKVEKAQKSIWKRICWNLYWLINDHAKISEELSEHITASIEVPDIWQDTAPDSGGSSKTGAPWPYYVVGVVASDVNGIDYGLIWDMPLAELICHKVIIGERNGQYRIAHSELKAREKRRKAGANGSD
jgi:hypothetical protein